MFAVDAEGGMTTRERIEAIEDDLRAERAKLEVERQQRNQAIRQARLEGKTLGQIARIFGVSRWGARMIACQVPRDT